MPKIYIWVGYIHIRRLIYSHTPAMYIEASYIVVSGLHSHTGAIPTKPTTYKRVHIYIRRQDMPFVIGH